MEEALPAAPMEAARGPPVPGATQEAIPDWVNSEAWRSPDPEAFKKMMIDMINEYLDIEELD